MECHLDNSIAYTLRMEPDKNEFSVRYNPSAMLRRTGDISFDEDDFKSALGAMLFSIDWCIRKSYGQHTDKDDDARNDAFRSIVRNIPSPKQQLLHL